MQRSKLEQLCARIDGLQDASVQYMIALRQPVAHPALREPTQYQFHAPHTGCLPAVLAAPLFFGGMLLDQYLAQHNQVFLPGVPASVAGACFAAVLSYFDSEYGETRKRAFVYKGIAPAERVGTVLKERQVRKKLILATASPAPERFTIHHALEYNTFLRKLSASLGAQRDLWFREESNN